MFICTTKKILQKAQAMCVLGVMSTWMCLDGFQFWDALYFLALAAWLALPEPAITATRLREQALSLVLHRQFAH